MKNKIWYVVHGAWYVGLIVLLTRPSSLLHAQEPTPSPSGTICISAFSDENQNGVRDAGEPFKANVNLTISTRSDLVFSYDTDGVSEPFCLDRLDTGIYFVRHNPTGNQQATTATEQMLELADGEILEVVFGSFSPPDTPTPTPTISPTPLPTAIDTGPTATPNPSGEIYAEVQAGDSLWGVASRAGISLEELLQLNGLTEDSLVHPGDLLIVGYAEPEPTTTPIPISPTPSTTRPPPTATETAVPPPRTALCLLAFADHNQNGIYEMGEQLKTAVAFTVFNNQKVAGNLISDGVTDPQCIDLLPGSYQITRSSRPEETLTTEGNGIIILGRGDIIQLNFGSISATPSPANQPINPEQNTATPPPITTTTTTAELPETEQSESWLIFGAIGSLLLVIGVAIAIYIRK